MDSSVIDTIFSEECLASVTFKLKKKETSKSKTFEKKRFPVVVRPKVPVIPTDNHQFVNFTEESSTVPSSTVYCPKSDVARPRNKFIIARSVLSKPVKSIFKGSTDDVSRIISIVSNFQFYFQYLSFLEDQWHESYYPLYHYHPKKKTQKHLSTASNTRRGNMSSVVFINDTGNALTKEHSPSPSPSVNSAKDINDVSKYVDLCTSTYMAPPINESKDHGKFSKPSSYKDCTMKFSLNKVTKPKKSKKTKPQNDDMMKHYFQTFKSPLYGDRGEDICFNTE
ncbi:unnamed protein product [Wickerhamomyces anomalus]